MRNFQDTFETRKGSFIGAFSSCMTVSLYSLNVYSLHYVKSAQMRIFSGPYFYVFGPEKTPYLVTFHATLFVLAKKKTFN